MVFCFSEMAFFVKSGMEAVKSCWEAFANPRFQRFESFFLNKARKNIAQSEKMAQIA